MGEPINIIHGASGASATVYPFGATVTSFRNAAGQETFFVSRLAKRDGSKAIRGGIPLVFPQFGQPQKDMPQHGFLRCNPWQAGSPYSNEEEAGCEFTLQLKDVVKARGEQRWSAAAAAAAKKTDCSLRLLVKVTADALTTELTIRNTGESSFDYQTLFHTYYHVENGMALDKQECNVTGLAGYNVKDQITGETYEQGPDPIFVDREVDRIYTPKPEKPVVEVQIATGGGRKVSMKTSASTGSGKIVPVSAVVWNPYIDKAQGMSDFGDDQYHDMICVEPGILSGNEDLEPGQDVTMTQVIST